MRRTKNYLVRYVIEIKICHSSRKGKKSKKQLQLRERFVRDGRTMNMPKK